MSRYGTERVQCRQSIAGHGRVQLVNSNKLATLSFKLILADSCVGHLMRSFQWVLVMSVDTMGSCCNPEN